MKLFFFLLFFVLPRVYAENIRLNSEDSNIQYLVKKVGFSTKKIPVEGSISLDSLETLSGNISGTLKENIFSIKEAEFFLKEVYFLSGNAERDDKVAEMIEGGIKVGIRNFTSKLGGGKEKGTASLTINGITHSITVYYAMVKRGNNIFFQGSSQINREEFDMEMSGLAAVGNDLIDNNFTLKFNLALKL